MKSARLAVLIVLVLALSACRGLRERGDAGLDGSVPERFAARGTVELHPAGASWAQATQHLAPTEFEGLSISAEDPFLASRDAGEAELASAAQVGADGGFAFSDMPTKPVLFGVAALLTDPRPPAPELADAGEPPDASDSDAGADAGEPPDAAAVLDAGPVREFASTLTLLAAGKPAGDVTEGVVYALPIGAAHELEQLAHLPQGALESEGAIVGIVLDASGRPVEGAVVQALADTSVQVSYPSVDWTVLTTDRTSANGLFLVLGPLDPLNLEVAGRPEFGVARAMARRGALFLVVLRG